MTPLSPAEAEIVAGLDSSFQPVALALRNKALAAGLPFVFISGLRSRAQQAALAAEANRTTPAAAPGTSKHEVGFAFDLERQSPGVEQQVGALGQSLGLTWGGTFAPQPDPNHFEAPGTRASLAFYRNVKLSAGAALVAGGAWLLVGA